MNELIIDKSSWTKTKLGDLAEDISKRVDNPRLSKFDKFVGLEHILSGELKIKNWGKTENLGSSMKEFQAGDILFARRNAYLRRASLAQFDGVCSGDAFVLRENHKKIIPGFLAFLVNSNRLWDFANANAAGTMSKRVKWRDLAEFEFLLPPKEDQTKLAKLLWAADNVVSKDKELLEKCLILKDALRKKYFYEDKNTTLIELSKLGKITSGGTPDTNKKEYWENGNILWMSSGEVHKKKINDTEKKITQMGLDNSSAKMIPKETCVIAIAGQGKTKGTVAITEVELCTNQSVAAIIPNKEIINPYYLFHNLDSRYLEFRYITGKEDTRTGLNLDILKKFKIKIHNKSNMELITDKLTKIDLNIDKINGKLQSSQVLLKSLINEVFV